MLYYFIKNSHVNICLKSFKIVFISVISVLFLSLNSFISPLADTISFNSRVISQKKIILPTTLVLMKITPKIQDFQKFLQAVDSLFIDQFKLNQSIFSYISFGDQIYKMRDLDISYNSSSSAENTVYIAYTQNPSLQLVSNLKQVYNIKTVIDGRINFTNGTFNILESSTSVYDTLPSSQVNINISKPTINYNLVPDPGSLNKISVNFNNLSEYPLFKTDPSKIIVVSLNNNKESASDMFQNAEWYSTSRTGQIVENRIATNEPGTINFSAVVQAEAGKQSQVFSLAKTNGDLIPDTLFTLQFNVPDKGQKVVQVYQNSYAYTNIRQDPKISSRIVGFKNSGTKLLVLQDNVGGWTKVRFDGDKEGWAQTGSFVKPTN